MRTALTVTGADGLHAVSVGTSKANPESAKLRAQLSVVPTKQRVGFAAVGVVPAAPRRGEARCASCAVVRWYCRR
ncbi:MAG: hypothetical protein MZV65_40215 [Chromatiales bacterium]|nr:hypothetical protein [Chromatiales bacterium]